MGLYSNHVLGALSLCIERVQEACQGFAGTPWTVWPNLFYFPTIREINSCNHFSVFSIQCCAVGLKGRVDFFFIPKINWISKEVIFSIIAVDQWIRQWLCLGVSDLNPNPDDFLIQSSRIVYL